MSFGAVGCGRTDSAAPIATAAVGLNRTRVPLGGPLEMTYRFTVAEDAPAFTDDYRVFVHFLDADGKRMFDDGKRMFDDDHQPAVPTTSWEPGQQITYERRMIVPVYPYIGVATIAIGLYSEDVGDRLPLAGESMGQRAYRVATMEMAPQSESGFLVFEDGWYQAEWVPDVPDREWQWLAPRSPRPRPAASHQQTGGWQTPESPSRLVAAPPFGPARPAGWRPSPRSGSRERCVPSCPS